MSAPERPAAISVWDLPTRLFHWCLAAGVLLAWRTAQTRDIDLHRIAGSAVAGLLVFRLWWGVFGGSSARFSQFVTGPRAVLAYARTLFLPKSDTRTGHNPMGGWSVLAMLLCLILLVGFGLFATDTDGLDSGPFANLVSYDQGRLASHLHAFCFDALEALVCLHLAAILFYHLVKRQNLVGAMVTGRLRSEGPPLRRGSWLMLLTGLALGGLTSWLLIHFSAQA